MSVRVSVFVLLTALLLACGGSDSDSVQTDPTPEATPTTNTTPPPPVPTKAAPGGQLIVKGAEPIAFDFAPDGRLFYTLRNTGIYWTDLNAYDPNVEATEGVSFVALDPFLGNECGVLGIAVDPEFETNHYIYVYLTEIDPKTDESGIPRVIRYTDVDGAGTDRTVIVELPSTNPKTCAHVGGNVHFGPDGYLYISVGNMERVGTAADLSSPLGSMLRVNKEDGSAAPDNPFVDDDEADPRVFVYGLRNPWDFAFHPDTGRMYAPDNGPGNCDELNLLIAGTDYGWPGSKPDDEATTCDDLGGMEPIYFFSLPGTTPNEFPSNVAPAGVAFVREGVYPELGTGLLVCEFLTRFVRYLEFGGENGDEIVRDELIAQGCRFNVAVDPDGLIYISFDNGIYRQMPGDLSPPQG